MKMMCAKCGKGIWGKGARGSMKHPYCKKCFKEVWKNDEMAYLMWLGETHFL